MERFFAPLHWHCAGMQLDALLGWPLSTNFSLSLSFFFARRPIVHHLEALAAAAWIGDGRCTTMAASIWTQCSSAGVQLIWWAAENCSTSTTRR